MSVKNECLAVEPVTAPDGLARKMEAMWSRTTKLRQRNHYLFNIPLDAVSAGCRVEVGGRQMLMFASYSYLGLIGHPDIDAAAKQAIEEFGTGTHGVRLLAGSLKLHRELEETIAAFKKAEDCLTFSSGYAANLTTISTLVGRHDVVICDKLNHASIVDGCLLSGASFIRIEHNDMSSLERALASNASAATRLVVVDAVFSMDGDIVDLPSVIALCRRYNARLMVDEAHSIGMLGATGRGVEEHFGLEEGIDIKMGTMSKTIPSAGGYVAGDHELINLLRHAARAYIFSAALTPGQAAAAKAAFEVIRREPERVAALRANAARFLRGLRAHGFDTLRGATAIVPVICGSDERAYELARRCQDAGIFVLPVVSPAVPEGTARLRATVTASHTADEIDRSVAIMARAAQEIGIL